ncbi:MAG: RNA polymerase sigma-70 factor [Bacteroidota bacterium]
MSVYHTYSEEQLIAFLRSGDHAAFTEIYNRYWEKLADAAYQRLRSREEAEEVVQEVFVSLYVRREEISPRSTLEAYLKTALKFKVIDAYRSQQLHYNHIDSLRQEASLPPLPADDQLDMKDLKKRVRDAADRLPDRCREVFIMSRYEQLSHQEIAERTGIAVSTVKKHLHRAMEILREEFKGNHFELMLLCLLLFVR